MQYYVNNENQSVPKKIKILITEDHSMVREAWLMILNNDPRFQVVGDAGSAEKTIEMVKFMKPDVLLLDINLPGMSGIEAISLIRESSPQTAILGVSLHMQPSYAR